MRGATTVWRLKISRRLKKSPRRLRKVIDWVIGSVPQTDMEQIRQAARRAAEAAVCYIRDGADTAVDRYKG